MNGGEEFGDDSGQENYDFKDYKIALAGDYGVGKTSLFRRMFNLGFCEEKPPSSTECDIYKETFNDRKTVIGFNIWDTVDMEKHDSISQSYYRGSHFVLLVYDTTEITSLQKLQVIANDVRRYEPMAKLVLVRNKTDLDLGPYGITITQEKTFLRNMKQQPYGTFPTSAKNNEGIHEMLRELAKLAYKMSILGSMRQIDYTNDKFAHLNLDDEPNKPQTGCCSYSR